MGYMVDETGDSRDATRFSDGSRIDLVISGFNMPIMDGGSLVEYIWSKDQYKYIPNFMLSTETSIEKQKRAKEAKITAWIKKPFEITEFKKLIEKVLS
jgi:two-component system, chemotaxis family, chemotaxis protein CheY